MKFDGNSFSIEDNCGGMDIEIAREYAFKFGREDESDPQQFAHSIGQFGVGMKRTLFKLGTKFTITSRTTSNSFVINEDVNDWRGRPGWNFRFAEYSDEDTRDFTETGTTITVIGLHHGVSEQLALESFENELARDIQLKHMRALAAGLVVRVNTTALQAKPLLLVENDEVKPARWTHTYNGQADPVRVLLLVGIAGASRSDGGWYVFCNDRLVVGPDQTPQTVWGPRAGLGIPGFHPEYYEFRGYAFFDSDTAARLPWTTTKTGIDEDAPIWKHTRRQMAELTKQVVTFLRLADRQGDAAKNAGAEDRADLAQNVLRRAIPIAIDNVTGSSTFEYPDVVFEGLEADYQFIRYRKPRRDYERAQELLGAESPGEVGEKTFDYYLEKFGDD